MRSGETAELMQKTQGKATFKQAEEAAKAK